MTQRSPRINARIKRRNRRREHRLYREFWLDMRDSIKEWHEITQANIDKFHADLILAHERRQSAAFDLTDNDAAEYVEVSP